MTKDLISDSQTQSMFDIGIKAWMISSTAVDGDDIHNRKVQKEAM
jgi:hypothetical protein